MATKKKMLQAAAGNATGGAGLDIDEVFKIHLYRGNGSARSINNGIDLSNEGGIILTKARASSQNFALADTEQGVGKYLQTNSTSPTRTDSYAQETYVAFNNNGYNLGIDSGADTVNRNNYSYVSWTWRKAPKFFDVVTYNGTGSVQNISHDLGTEPGMIIVKSTSGSDSFRVYHRGAHASSPQNYYLNFNEASAPAASTTIWNDTAPTSTQFTVGTSASVNGSSDSYIAYLFAHNNNDGGFGPDGNADVIKCDTYTGNGSTNGPEIDLGFEPQLVMIKSVDDSGHWLLIDVMRGTTQGTYSTVLRPNTSDAEANSDNLWGIDILPNGFKPNQTQSQYNASGSKYIYMAIRRGSLTVPEDATKVFAIDTQVNQTPPKFDSGFAVDFELTRNVDSAANLAVGSRLIKGKQLNTDNGNAETDNPAKAFDFIDGWNNETSSTNSNVYSWMWKRAPGYFDVSTFTGNGGGVRTISHNLGVEPEMMWLKRRDGGSPYGDWYVQHTGISATNYLLLNDEQAQTGSPDAWDSTYAAADVFTVGPDNNVNNFEYIVYLFSSCPGVSKVGSYTGNGTSQTIDCGFTAGARFVLLKVASKADSWFLWDSVRGINAGSEPYIRTNLSAAQITSNDRIDPHSSGFSVDGTDSSNNQNGHTYIFYAIA